MHIRLYERILKIFSRNDSFSVFLFLLYPTLRRYGWPCHLARIVRILHLIEQLHKGITWTVRNFLCIYGVRSTCYTNSNPLLLNANANGVFYTQLTFAGCCVLQIDSSPGQRSILLSLFYGWQRHHAAFVLHSNIVARISLRLFYM